MNFFRWLFGKTCWCGGEYSVWTKNKQEVGISSILWEGQQRATRIYQERTCKKCGLIQQKSLEY